LPLRPPPCISLSLSSPPFDLFLSQSTYQAFNLTRHPEILHAQNELAEALYLLEEIQPTWAGANNGRVLLADFLQRSQQGQGQGMNDYEQDDEEEDEGPEEPQDVGMGLGQVPLGESSPSFSSFWLS
jgi:hypothetical protein